MLTPLPVLALLEAPKAEMPAAIFWQGQSQDYSGPVSVTVETRFYLYEAASDGSLVCDVLPSQPSIYPIGCSRSP